MSDLSKVLGDLYDSSEAAPVPAASRFQPTAPEWADEDRLDEAFSSWTPGPPADAHSTEREMSVVIDTPYVPAARLDDDLTATLSQALVDAGHDNRDPEVPVASAPSYTLPAYDDEPLPLAGHLAAVPAYSEPMPAPAPAPSYEPAYEPVVEAYRPWSRGDDDIIPGKGGNAHAPVGPLPKGKSKGEGKGKGKKVKEPKAPKLKKGKAEKAESNGEPKKFFGIQLRK